MSGAACPCCGCAAPGGSQAHAVAGALREDDFDAAMTLGLLDPASACAACAPACRARVDAARESRLQALAARERHRARALRLERRERERADRRKPVPATDAATTTASAAPAPALPPAAAAALARAKARAAASRG